MGLIDFVKNILKIRKREEEDETVDLRRANIESTNGKSVELEDEDALSEEDSEAAAKIEKAGIAQKAADAKEAKQQTLKKINLICNSCNYKFTRAEDNVPNMCPYCGKDLGLKF